MLCKLKSGIGKPKYVLGNTEMPAVDIKRLISIETVLPSQSNHLRRVVGIKSGNTKSLYVDS